MSNTKRGFGSAGLIIVILIIIAGGAYFWSQKKVEAPTSTDISAPVVDTTDWKTYSNSNYTIRYPQDWLLDFSKAIPADEYAGSQVTLTKENHRFEIYIPSASSPSTCLFEGDPPYTTKGEASTVKITGDYIEVKSSSDTFRRSVNPKPIDGRTNEQVFSICQKYKDSNFFHTSNNVSFSVPINYNKNLVLQMDEILKTFEDK